ncbi:serine/threonine-protein kinase [Nonomuraea glycinis]|uniref:serine/threonine-protein kinase n=1 Tax=Nonomuraea glycinis TaxID=2047744 RepID=UPI0033A69A1C
MPDLEPLRTGDPASVGAYTLTDRLGEGGQGTVYLALAPGGHKVAVKLLRADLAGDHEASVRFVREVELARRVAPFCTAQVVETGLFHDRPYIISEYIDGPTLTEVVRTQGPRSGTSLHRLAIGTVTALVAIHQAGIVHRDFKPSNVLLASDGPRVIDFGIARALDFTSTLTASAIGTPSFMAPEQLTEATPGPASDMFAWACTLLYAASGHTPFGHDSLPAVINRILNSEADVTPVEDHGLRSLVVDCLAKDPARRPSASQALMRLLGHAPAALVPEGFAPGPGAPMPAPNSGFPAPSSGFSTPSSGFPAPNGGFPAPNSGLSTPSSGFPTPNSGASGPVGGAPGPAGAPGPGGPALGGGRTAPTQWMPEQAAGVHGTGAPAGLLQQGSAAAAGPGGWQGHGPPPPPHARPLYQQPNPARRGGNGWIAAVAAAGVLVLVIAAAVVSTRIIASSGTTPSPTPADTSASREPTPSPTPTPTPTPATPTTIELRGSAVRIEERDSDPLKLASYSMNSGKNLYVRQPGTDVFTADTRYFEYALNGDGTQALGTDVDYSTDKFALLSVIDHRAGTKRAIKVSANPIFPTTPRWSPDGKLALVTLYTNTGGESVEYGFGIVDVAAGTARTFRVREKGAGEWRFFWDADGQAVGTWVGGKMKFYDLNGKELRTLSDVGSPVWVEGDDVSSSGSRFLAHCTTTRTTICLRSTSGDDSEPVTVPFASDRLIGWWDEEHLAVWRSKGAGREAVVIDLSGKVVRVLATAPKRAEFDKMAFRFSRGTP